MIIIIIIIIWLEFRKLATVISGPQIVARRVTQQIIPTGHINIMKYMYFFLYAQFNSSFRIWR